MSPRKLSAVLTLAATLVATAARAETAPAPPSAEAPAKPLPCACAPAAPPAPTPQFIEVTFGSTQLFAHQSLIGENGAPKEQIIPVISALLMIEWLFRERASVLALANFPLGTQKVYSNGMATEDYLAPSVALGLRVSALRLTVFSASRLELQLAALGGVTIGSLDGDKLFPLAAVRLHFATQAGFALYLGSAFAFQKDTLAMLYGIGHRF